MYVDFTDRLFYYSVLFQTFNGFAIDIKGPAFYFTCLFCYLLFIYVFSFCYLSPDFALDFVPCFFVFLPFSQLSFLPSSRLSSFSCFISFYYLYLSLLHSLILPQSSSNSTFIMWVPGSILGRDMTLPIGVFGVFPSPCTQMLVYDIKLRYVPLRSLRIHYLPSNHSIAHSGHGCLVFVCMCVRFSVFGYR
jgi:hypothetical protein